MDDTRAEQGGEERARREPAGPEGGFRVVDRRRIRSDGEPAAAGPAAGEPAGRTASSRPSAEPSPESSATRSAESPDAGDSTARSEGGPQARVDAAAAAGTRTEGTRGLRGSRPLPPPTFSTLVNTLALNAVAALGLAGDRDEEGAPAASDLPLARHTIDLLGMLEQKTSGNLSPDEARFLEQTLFDLRMLFVRASSRTG